MCWWFGQIIIALGFEKLPKYKKSSNLVTLYYSYFLPSRRSIQKVAKLFQPNRDIPLWSRTLYKKSSVNEEDPSALITVR